MLSWLKECALLDPRKHVQQDVQGTTWCYVLKSTKLHVGQSTKMHHILMLQRLQDKFGEFIYLVQTHDFYICMTTHKPLMIFKYM